MVNSFCPQASSHAHGDKKKIAEEIKPLTDYRVLRYSRGVSTRQGRKCHQMQWRCQSSLLFKVNMKKKMKTTTRFSRDYVFSAVTYSRNGQPNMFSFLRLFLDRPPPSLGRRLKQLSREKGMQFFYSLLRHHFRNYYKFVAKKAISPPRKCLWTSIRRRENVGRRSGMRK